MELCQLNTYILLIMQIDSCSSESLLGRFSLFTLLPVNMQLLPHVLHLCANSVLVGSCKKKVNLFVKKYSYTWQFKVLYIK